MKIATYTNNTFQMQGRITEMHEYSKDKAANVNLVVDTGADKNGKQNDPYWIQLKSFQPSVYNMLKKGMLVRVYGHVVPNKYTNKAGQTIYQNDLIADGIDFLESKSVVNAREVMKDI